MLSLILTNFFTQFSSRKRLLTFNSLTLCQASQPSKLFASRLVIADEINSHNVNSIADPQNIEVCSQGSGFDCDIQGSISTNIVRVGGNISVDGKVRIYKELGLFSFRFFNLNIVSFLFTGVWMESR